VIRRCDTCIYYKVNALATTPCTGFCLNEPPKERCYGAFQGKFTPSETKNSWACSRWECNRIDVQIDVILEQE